MPSDDLTTIRRAGIAISIGRAVAGSIGIALVWVAGQPAIDGLYAKSSEVVGNESAQEGIDFVYAVNENFLVLWILVTLLGVIVASAYQSQRV